MPSRHVIEAVEIRGATHFPDFRIDLAEGLNCIIAGRGAGKTTVLHLVRYGLGAPPPAIPEVRARYEAQVTATLGGGRVTVRVRTAHGMVYASSRGVGESMPSVVDADGAAVNVSLTGELFRSDVYGPHEIETLAQNAEAQRALIDGFAEVPLRRVREEITQLERRLAHNATTLQRLEREIEEDDAQTSALPLIEEALKGLERVEGSDADEMARARAEKTLRGRERTTLEEVHAELSRARARLASTARDSAADIARTVDGALANGTRSAHFRRVYDAVDRGVAEIARAVTALDAALGETTREVTAVSQLVAGAHAVDEATYAALLAQHDEDRTRAVEREHLRARHDELSHVRKRAAERRREHQTLRDERDAQLCARAKLRAQRYEIRAGVVARLGRDLAGEVRVSLHHDRDTRAYLSLLGELLHGSKIRTDTVETLTRAVPPDELARAIRDNDPTPLMAVDESKTQKEERAAKILGILRGHERVREIDTVAVDDMVTIELRIGTQYRASNAVSTGQSCTCILPIVLLQSEGPLFIDQPEDNLDNAFVYQVLVQSLRKLNAKRQIVVVTHNPNIPTLGGTERVFLLEADGRTGRLARSGSVHELRGEIERLLDGGSEAFVARAARYGYEIVKAPDAPSDEDRNDDDHRDD